MGGWGSWWVGLRLWKKGPEKQVPHQVDPNRAPPEWEWGLGLLGDIRSPCRQPCPGQSKEDAGKPGPAEAQYCGAVYRVCAGVPVAAGV